MEIENDEIKPAPGRLARFRSDWHLQVLVSLVIIVGVVGIGIALRLQDPSQASKPFRIGFQQSPPFQFVSNGTPTGPAIEIVAEAARRRHIPVEWVLSPDG